MIKNNNVDIKLLSSYLFWDVNPLAISFEKDKKWLISRILEYGTYNDWLLIKKRYGIIKIAEIAMSSRDLSKKSASFLSAISGFPKEKFVCYSTIQSPHNFWNS